MIAKLEGMKQGEHFPRVELKFRAEQVYFQDPRIYYYVGELDNGTIVVGTFGSW